MDPGLRTENYHHPGGDYYSEGEQPSKCTLRSIERNKIAQKAKNSLDR